MTNTYTNNDATRTTTEAASDEAANLAAAATEQAEGVATAATGAAQQVAGTVTEEASRVAGEAAAQGRNLVEDARSQLHEQASGQTERLSQTLRKLSDEARALSQGRAEDAGPVRDYVEQAASQLNLVASRIDERGFDGVVDDVRRFARRRPGAFLLGTALAGFAAGRLIKAGRSGGDQAGQPVAALPPATPTMAPATPAVAPATPASAPATPAVPAMPPASGVAGGLPGVDSIEPPTAGVPGSVSTTITPPPAVPPVPGPGAGPATSPSVQP
ncbi:MAG: hypothetical protein KY439_07815 [Actinobacteria bacterium]|nr:hypothetical protein [Actinomycetota bacterium]